MTLHGSKKDPLFPEQFEVEVPPEWRIAISAVDFVEAREEEGKPFIAYVFSVDLLWQRSEDRSWRICRRYNEFREMHHALSAKFPDHPLPSLPPRVMIHNQKNFHRRHALLEQYLQTLLQSTNRAFRGTLLSWLHPRFSNDGLAAQRTLADTSTTLSQRLDSAVGDREDWRHGTGGSLSASRERSHTHIYNFGEGGLSSSSVGSTTSEDSKKEGKGTSHHRKCSAEALLFQDNSEGASLWNEYLTGVKAFNPLVLRKVAKSGQLPNRHRGKMWQICLGCKKKARSFAGEYGKLLADCEKEANNSRMMRIMKQVDKDIRRTTVSDFTGDQEKLLALR